MSYRNGYESGYKKGFNDGLFRRPKSNTVGFGITELAVACVSHQTYIDTFLSGYEKGYSEGLKT
jgi:hypothetical protein